MGNDGWDDVASGLDEWLARVEWAAVGVVCIAVAAVGIWTQRTRRR